MSISRLEDRLRVLDLQLLNVGLHLSDERLAVVAGGGEPDSVEARHLAGCDDCVEILVMLGEGLEAVAEERPGLAALVAPRPAPPPRRTVGLVTVFVGIGVAAAAAAATIGYVVRSADPVSVVEPIHAPTRPHFGPQVVPAPKLTPEKPPAEPERSQPATSPPQVAEPEPEPASLQTPEPPKPAAAPQRRRAPPRESPPASPQTREPTPAVGLAGRGQTRLERTDINGPPRGWGVLRLTTKPPARVFVDGKSRGWTPIVELRLPEGPHDVRLVYDSPLAAEPERRFRVLIDPDEPWVYRQANLRRDP